MKHSRIGLAVAALAALMALTSCSVLGGPSATGASAPSSSTSVPPVAPTAATAKPTATPSKSPKPTLTVIQPAAAIQPAKRSAQQGVGPANSAKSTGSQAVALTFDDGPDPVQTPALLDQLRKNGVKATFCLVGRQAKKYPDLVRRIYAEGHTLCNHSWSHRFDLGKQTYATIREELSWTNNAIHEAAPQAKIKYFRAPGGYFTTRLVRLADQAGMKSIYWGLDTRDWDFSHFGRGIAMTNHIITVVTGGVRPGTIVLAHDYRKPDTIEAFRVLLPWLKARVKLIALPV